MIRWLVSLLIVGLAGCASTRPAPVADSTANRVENIKLAKPAAGKTEPARPAPPAPASPDGAVVRPIAGSGPVAARSLDEAPIGTRPLASSAAAPAPSPSSTPGAMIAPGNTETFKRSPKGGKLPYSSENLALLKAREGGQSVSQTLPTPAPSPAPAPPPAPAPAPGSVPAATDSGALAWGWPTGGKLLAGFSESGGGEMNKGIDIAGRTGEPVLAAANGKVIHVGSELRGLGNFVVIKHSADFLSVYGHNSRILVKQDQTVTRGQKIAELGSSDSDQPKLHFEVRQQGKPVDPLRFLPAR